MRRLNLTIGRGALSFLMLSCCLLAQPSAQAKNANSSGNVVDPNYATNPPDPNNPYDPNNPNSQQYQQPPLKFDQQTLLLVVTLSHQPELMNLDYLEYYLGRPENEKAMASHGMRNYYWYEPGKRRLKYQLRQSQLIPGQMVESRFDAFTPDSKVDLEDIDDAFQDIPSKKRFNEKGVPTQVFQFVPNTTVEFTQPHNAFAVQQIVIRYDGPPLKQPDQQAMGNASDFRKAKLDDYVKKGNWNEALPLLQQHLKEHPEDVISQIDLADAYKYTGHLNEAIGQYQIALGNSGAVQELSDRCYKGLQDTKVLPSRENPKPELDKEHHKMKWHNQAQALDQGKLASNEKDPGYLIGHDPNPVQSQQPSLDPPSLLPANFTAQEQLPVKPIDPPDSAFALPNTFGSEPF